MPTSDLMSVFSRPDPMDPNDRKRQQTQARSGDYPYDMPVMYGRDVGVDDNGSSYQFADSPNPPPTPRNKKASDEVPKDPWTLASESLGFPSVSSDDIDGMGDGFDPVELDIDALRQEFRDSFMGTLPKAIAMGSIGLFKLLTQVDPDFSAELFAPDEDDEMGSIYKQWGSTVYAPGAEYDSGTEYDLGDTKL